GLQESQDLELGPIHTMHGVAESPGVKLPPVLLGVRLHVAAPARHQLTGHVDVIGPLDALHETTEQNQSIDLVGPAIIGVDQFGPPYQLRDEPLSPTSQK